MQSAIPVTSFLFLSLLKWRLNTVASFIKVFFVTTELFAGCALDVIIGEDFCLRKVATVFSFIHFFSYFGLNTLKSVLEIKINDLAK